MAIWSVKNVEIHAVHFYKWILLIGFVLKQHSVPCNASTWHHLHHWCCSVNKWQIETTIGAFFCNKSDKCCLSVLWRADIRIAFSQRCRCLFSGVILRGLECYMCQANTFQPQREQLKKRTFENTFWSSCRCWNPALVKLNFENCTSHHCDLDFPHLEQLDDGTRLTQPWDSFVTTVAKIKTILHGDVS